MKFVYQGFKLSFIAGIVSALFIGFIVLADYVFSTGSLVYSFLYLFFVLGVLFSFALYWADRNDF